MTQFWWVIYPYLTLAVTVVGTLYRYQSDQIGWGSKSSEWLEKRFLRWGSLLFHWGILFIIGGHIVGLLIPVQVFDALGIHRELYHRTADLFGGLAGVAAWVGVLLLLIRRMVFDGVRRNSSAADFLALILLFLVITLGDMQTVIMNNVFGPYGYRHTVGPWLRGLLTLHPNAQLMVNVPIILQIHIILSFALFAVSPFTRLVHVWSAPLRYPTRAPIQYRSRTGFKR